MAVLGIDFGTSYSFIVKLSESDGKERVELFGKDLYEAPRSANAAVGGDASFYLKHSKGIRTWIALTHDGRWIVGKKNIEAALENKTVSKENVCRNIKDLLRNCTENAILNKSVDCGKKFTWTNDETGKKESEYYTGIKLATEFFKGIVQSNKNNLISVKTDDINMIVIGAPACEVQIKEQAGKDSFVYHANLTEKVLPGIRDALGLDPKRIKMSVWPEPILAGFAYRKLGAIGKEQDLGRTLVIDIGGGTSDFAIVENRNGKFSLFKQSGGGLLPAGDAFNENLCNVIRTQFNDVKIDENDPGLENAKEELFLSPYSPRFESSETGKTDYRAYYERGRRSVIPARIGSESKILRIAFDKDSLSGVPGDVGNGERWDVQSTAIWDTKDGFREVFDRFKINFQEFWKYIIGLKEPSAEKMEEMFQSVFFVGGTCAMFPLRYRICRDLLGLHTVKDSKTGKVVRWIRKGSQKEVEVVFPELESGSYLSCSNTIALGAAYFGAYLLQKGDPVGLEFADIPELWLRLPQTPDYPLLSEQFMQNGSRMEGEPLPCIIDFEAGERPQFQIVRKKGGKEVVYPRGGNYYGALPPRSLRGKRYAALLLADYEVSGVVIYVCYFDPDGNPDLKRNRVTDYVYKFRDKSQLRLSETELGEAFSCGISAIGKSGYCRRYVFASGKDAMEGKRYAIRYDQQNARKHNQSANKFVVE